MTGEHECLATCVYTYEEPKPCQVAAWLNDTCYLGNFATDNGGSVVVANGVYTVYMERGIRVESPNGAPVKYFRLY